LGSIASTGKKTMGEQWRNVGCSDYIAINKSLYRIYNNTNSDQSLIIM
jgi:hypothetical protein